MKIDTSKRKRFRVSNKVKKVASKERFRLSLLRSSKNIFAQIIDDNKNRTLVSASSIEKEMKTENKVNKSELSKKDNEKKQQAKTIAESLNKKEFDIQKLCTETKELYGSVKPTEISKSLEEKNKIFLSITC